MHCLGDGLAWCIVILDSMNLMLHCLRDGLALEIDE